MSADLDIDIPTSLLNRVNVMTPVYLAAILFVKGQGTKEALEKAIDEALTQERSRR